MSTQVSFQTLSRYFTYDGLSGSVSNRFYHHSKKTGQRADFYCKATGDRVIDFCGERLKAHDVAWTLATREVPRAPIIHINGVRTDNRLINLDEKQLSRFGKWLVKIRDVLDDAMASTNWRVARGLRC